MTQLDLANVAAISTRHLSFVETGRLSRALERAIPMRRLGRPDDYLGIVAFLLSDDAGFITG